MQYLIKLKTLSNYKKITIVLLFIVLSISIIYSFVPRKSKIKPTDKEFLGYVHEFEVKENYTSFELMIPSYKNEIIKCVAYRNIELEYHDLVKVEGTLEEITDFNNFYSFSYPKWANRKGMFYKLKVQKLEVINENINIFYELKNNIVRFLNRHPSNNYLYAFLLGDTSKISENVLKSFQENVISHLFAVSGMHLSFLVLWLEKIFRKMHLKKNISKIIILLLLFLYSYLASFSVSILRAYFFYLFKTIKRYFENKDSDIYPLINVFTFVLMLNPNYLFEISFQYSFAISFAIVLSSSKLKKVKSKILSSLYLSFLSFFVSLPITIYHFHQVNMLSIFYNLLFIPYVSCILFPLSFIIFLFPFLAFIYKFLIRLLESISLFLANIEFGILIMPHPNMTSLFIIILVVFIGMILFLKNFKYAIIWILFFLVFYTNINILIKEEYVVTLDQTTTNMIQRLKGIFARKPLISRGI